MFQKDICEIKRLYIKEEYRGYRFGEKLMKKVIQDAQEIGYHQIYLDTLDFMKSAIHVYQKLGFQEISAYYYNPIKGAMYFSLNI